MEPGGRQVPLWPNQASSSVVSTSNVRTWQEREASSTSRTIAAATASERPAEGHVAFSHVVPGGHKSSASTICEQHFGVAGVVAPPAVSATAGAAPPCKSSVWPLAVALDSRFSGPPQPHLPCTAQALMPACQGAPRPEQAPLQPRQSQASAPALQAHASWGCPAQTQQAHAPTAPQSPQQTHLWARGAQLQPTAPPDADRCNTAAAANPSGAGAAGHVIGGHAPLGPGQTVPVHAEERTRAEDVYASGKPATSTHALGGQQQGQQGQLCNAATNVHQEQRPCERQRQQLHQQHDGVQPPHRPQPSQHWQQQQAQRTQLQYGGLQCNPQHVAGGSHQASQQQQQSQRHLQPPCQQNPQHGYDHSYVQQHSDQQPHQPSLQPRSAWPRSGAISQPHAAWPPSRTVQPQPQQQSQPPPSLRQPQPQKPQERKQAARPHPQLEPNHQQPQPDLRPPWHATGAQSHQTWTRPAVQPTAYPNHPGQQHATWGAPQQLNGTDATRQSLPQPAQPPVPHQQPIPSQHMDHAGCVGGHGAYCGAPPAQSAPEDGEGGGTGHGSGGRPAGDGRCTGGGGGGGSGQGGSGSARGCSAGNGCGAAGGGGGGGTGGVGGSAPGGAGDGDGERGIGTPGGRGSRGTPGGGRRGSAKKARLGGAGEGDDDEVIPAANPFLRFTGSPPSTGKRRGVAAAASPPPGASPRQVSGRSPLAKANAGAAVPRQTAQRPPLQLQPSVPPPPPAQVPLAAPHPGQMQQHVGQGPEAQPWRSQTQWPQNGQGVHAAGQSQPQPAHAMPHPTGERPTGVAQPLPHPQPAPQQPWPHPLHQPPQQQPPPPSQPQEPRPPHHTYGQQNSHHQQQQWCQPYPSLDRMRPQHDGIQPPQQGLSWTHITGPAVSAPAAASLANQGAPQHSNAASGQAVQQPDGPQPNRQQAQGAYNPRMPRPAWPPPQPSVAPTVQPSCSAPRPGNPMPAAKQAPGNGGASTAAGSFAPAASCVTYPMAHAGGPGPTAPQGAGPGDVASHVAVQAGAAPAPGHGNARPAGATAHVPASRAQVAAYGGGTQLHGAAGGAITSHGVASAGTSSQWQRPQQEYQHQQSLRQGGDAGQQWQGQPQQGAWGAAGVAQAPPPPLQQQQQAQRLAQNPHAWQQPQHPQARQQQTGQHGQQHQTLQPNQSCQAQLPQQGQPQQATASGSGVAPHLHQQQWHGQSLGASSGPATQQSQLLQQQQQQPQRQATAPPPWHQSGPSGQSGPPQQQQQQSYWPQPSHATSGTVGGMPKPSGAGPIAASGVPPHPHSHQQQAQPGNGQQQLYNGQHQNHKQQQYPAGQWQQQQGQRQGFPQQPSCTGWALGSGGGQGAVAGAPAPGAQQKGPAPEFRGRCPYKRCPGVYQPCNADLVWIRPYAFAPPPPQPHHHPGGAPAPPPFEPSGYWRCCRYPECGWRYYPHPRLREPVLSLEIVGDNVFKVVPFPGAEDAVAAAGGVACVLAGAGLNLSGALTWEQARRLMARNTGDLSGALLPVVASADASAAPALRAPSVTVAHSCDSSGGESGGDGACAAGAAAAAAKPSSDPAAAGGGALDPNDDGDDAALYFPLHCYESLLAPLPRHSSLFNAGSLIPEPVRRAYRGQFQERASAAEVEARLCRMPPSLRAALMPFQRQGVEFGLARRGRCLVADEMGVGKTVQAIALAACYEDEWPLLCIVPASLRLVWAEELEKWLPYLRPSHIHVIEGKANRLTGRLSKGQGLPRITITSYEMMRRLTCPACSKTKLAPPPPLPGEAGTGSGGGGGTGGGGASGKGGAEGGTAAAAQASSAAPPGPSLRSGGGGCSKATCWGPDRCMAAMAWGMVIVDESHNLRTTNSRDADSPHTEACVAALSRARRAVLLSGTPSLSRPYDLYRQVDALQPGLVGASKQAFAFRYCDGRMVPQRLPAAHAARPFRGYPGGGGGGEGGSVVVATHKKRLETSGGSRLAELHGLLTREVMIRRLKRDVMAQLPPKRRQVVRLPHPRSWPDEAPAEAAATTAGGGDADGNGKRAAAASGKGGDGGSAGRGAKDAAVKQGGGVRGRPAKRRKRGEASAADGAAGGEEDGANSSDDGEADENAGEQDGYDTEDAGDTDDEGANGGKAAAGGTADAATAAAGTNGAAAAAEAAADGGAAAPARPPAMSSAHRTALAKLPDAIAWLVGALGGGGVAAEGSGRSGQRLRRQSARGEAARAEVSAARGGAGPAAAGSSGADRGTGLAPHEQPPKFLVFAHHRDVMDRLAEALQGFDGADGASGGGGDEDEGGGGGSGGSTWRGVEYVRIDGSHDSAERRAAVMRFRDDPAVRVALLSITAAAVGLDFSSASAVVFVELPNEVSLLQQAEDRAHRKGQAHTCVNVYFLCAKGTCDDKRWQKLNESLTNISQVHDGAAAAEPAPDAVGSADGGDGGGAAASGAARAAVRGGLTVDAVVEIEREEEPGAEPGGPKPADAANLHSNSHAPTGHPPPDSAPALGDVATISDGAPEAKAPDATGATAGSALATPAAAAVSRARGAGTADESTDVVDLSSEPPSQPPQQQGTSRASERPGGIDLSGDAKEAGRSPANPKPGSAVKARRRSGASPRLPPARDVYEFVDTDSDPDEPAAKHAAKDAGTSAAIAQPTRQQLKSTQRAGAGLPCGVPLTPGSAITPSRAALLKLLPPSTTFYFEVSSHTGRVHLHLAADGSRPAGLSLPLELLLAHPRSAVLRAILDQHAARWSREEAAGRAVQRQQRLQLEQEHLRRGREEQAQQQEQGKPPEREPGQAASQLPAQVPCFALAAGVNSAAAAPLAAGPDVPGPAVDAATTCAADGAGSTAAPTQLPRSSPAAAIAANTAADSNAAAPAAAASAPDTGSAGPTDLDADQADTRERAARLSFVGPVGLVAPLPHLSPAALAEGVAEAAAFARDWRELRAVSRNRLYGAVLERYFQDALEAVTSEAVAAGAYGSGTARYVQDAPMKVPEGATLRPVQVRTDPRFSSGNSNNGNNGSNGANGGGVHGGSTSSAVGWRTYQQAFMPDGARLCLNCSKPVPDCSLPPSSHLDNTDYLFCDPSCETRYFLKASGSALRRTLARLEHGVCQMCGLDCANLVRQLQTIRVTSRDYLAKRRAVVERLAPRLARHGYAALLERLLRSASEGLAWQADHITPVYAGGGMCDVDNMRTLCVACHLDVTKAQCKQRAADRAQRRMGTRDIRSFWGQGGEAGGLPPLPAGKRKGDAAAGAVSKRRRAAASRPAYIDSSDDSPSRTPLPAAAAAAAARGAVGGRGAAVAPTADTDGVTKAAAAVATLTGESPLRLELLDVAAAAAEEEAEYNKAGAAAVAALLPEVVDLSASDDEAAKAGGGGGPGGGPGVAAGDVGSDDSVPAPNPDVGCRAPAAPAAGSVPASAHAFTADTAGLAAAAGGGERTSAAPCCSTSSSGAEGPSWTGRLRQRVMQHRGARSGRGNDDAATRPGLETEPGTEPGGPSCKPDGTVSGSKGERGEDAEQVQPVGAGVGGGEEHTRREVEAGQRTGRGQGPKRARAAADGAAPTERRSRLALRK